MINLYIFIAKSCLIRNVKVAYLGTPTVGVRNSTWQGLKETRCLYLAT